MTVNWDSYEIYDPTVRRPLHELPRKDARVAFERLMEQKSARVDTLKRLVKLNGVELEGGSASIQNLNDWFAREVREDPERPGRLEPIWYSVVNDIALYLGDIMIKRNADLHWDCFVGGKKDVSCQRHVLMGFTARNPKYNVDVDRLLGTYGHQLVAGVSVDDSAFWKWLLGADAQAAPT